MTEFNALVAEHLKIDADRVADELTPKDVPNWDSMNYLLLISELEKNFDVSFTMDEVLGAQSLGDVRKMLKSKGANV